ncbi:hypothetical protein Bca4012_073165 [Brassica carinata]|uniref:(rape) hypothetical protein n=1 Tax=Brassica napus TaxID=3708 RepID=A0A816L9J4_BRANA|nr:unnamed protein product [Brassica napus]
MLFLLFPFRVMWCLVLSSLATSFSPLLSLQCPLFVALTVSVIQFPVFFVEARARKFAGVYWLGHVLSDFAAFGSFMKINRSLTFWFGKPWVLCVGVVTSIYVRAL